MNRIEVLVACRPTNAHFSVSYAGGRKLWGACAPQDGVVAGEFAVHGARRDVGIAVAGSGTWATVVLLSSGATS